eukprot:scpid65759/ scgid15896/ 
MPAGHGLHSSYPGRVAVDREVKSLAHYLLLLLVLSDCSDLLLGCFHCQSQQRVSHKHSEILLHVLLAFTVAVTTLIFTNTVSTLTVPTLPVPLLQTANPWDFGDCLSGSSTGPHAIMESVHIISKDTFMPSRLMSWSQCAFIQQGPCIHATPTHWEARKIHSNLLCY